MICHDCGCAAITQQQHLFAVQIDAVARERRRKAENIRIVADRLAITECHSVDRVQITCGGIDFIKQGNNRLLVRDRAVHAAQLALGKRKCLLELIGRHRDADVIRILPGNLKQLRVQLRAHGVAKRPADQCVGGLLRLERTELIHGKQHWFQPPNCCSVVKKSG